MSVIAPVSRIALRERAIASCERAIARYERELEQPMPSVDIAIARRGVIAALVADYRVRLEALQRAA